MKVLDLFSGIGGFSLGLERAGFETVAFCEIDPFCRKVLKKHWPDIPIYEDVRDVTKARLESDGITGIDVITGGFPCQDISVAGKQAGIEGERSGLWSELARIIGDIRPKYAIVENVTALISGERGRWFGRVIGDLAEIGYDTEWHCIPASELGANHHRDRVWVIAHTESEQGDGSKLKTNEHQRSRLRQPGNSDRQDDDSDNRSERIQRIFREKIPRQQAFSWCESIRGIEDLRNRSDLPEPTIRRTNDGIRNRLHAIGNAAIPQIPELIGRAIKEYENATR